MSVSKISRGLVVCIFTLFILILIGLDIYAIIQDSEMKIENIYLKLLYIFALVAIMVVYSIVKEEFSKRNLNKIKSIIIRYTIILVIAFIIKVFIGVFIDNEKSITNSIVYAILALLNAIILKKIIYNISKSDVLSVIGMIMYMFLPHIAISFEDVIISYIIVSVILLIIMFIEKIIDELKQIGIKNHKYILFSVTLGGLIAVSMVLGINSFIWIIIAAFSLICTSNLDRTHINFPNKFINTLRQRSKELLYRFERIYINKIFISLTFIIIVAILVYFGISYVIYNIVGNETISTYLAGIKVSNNLANSINTIISGKYIDILTNLKLLVSSSKIYSLILIIYIIFIEFLNVALRRKYDTKSTIIKVIFVSVVLSYSIFNLRYNIYTQVMLVFLILIAIINTTNLYLNRDERIKLLDSK